MKEPAVYKRNLDALHRHHPHVPPLLDAPPPFEMTVRPGAAGHLNLYWDKQGMSHALYSETDPTVGLSNVLDGLEDPNGRIVCHFGFGLGHHAREIIRVLGNSNIIILAEAHPAIFKAAMAHADLVEIISHPNVRLVVGTLPDFKEYLTGELERLFAIVRYQVIRYEGATALAPEWYGTVEEAMQRYNSAEIILHNTLEKAGRAMFENRFRNLLAMIHGRPVEAVSDKMTGMPAILVASGPSLSKNIHELKRAKGRALIIAADSAAAPLLTNGIVPDMVASGDWGDYTYEKLAPFKTALRQAALIFSAENSFKVPNYIPFKKRFYSFASLLYHDFFRRLLGENLTVPLGQSQSVIHLAMDFAIKAGCDPIIFTGLDLAFDGERDHAEGTILHWGNNRQVSGEMPQVMGVNGQMLFTHIGFLGMLDTCESMIRDHNKVTWIDSSEGGARVKGTRVVALSEAIGRWCTGAKDFEDMLPESCPIERIMNVINELEKCKTEAKDLEGKLDRYFKYILPTDQYLLSRGLPPGGPQDLPSSIIDGFKSAQRMNREINDNELTSLFTDLISGSRLDTYRKLKARSLSAEASAGAGERFLTAFELQKYVQSNRKDALEILKNQIGRQIHVLGEIAKREAFDSGPPDMGKRELALAAFYLDNNYVGFAEMRLESGVPEGVEREFLLGVIRLKQGDVSTGMELMQASVAKEPSLAARMARILEDMEADWLRSDGPVTYKKIVRRRLMAMGPSEKVIGALWPYEIKALNRMLGKADLKAKDLVAVERDLSEWEPAKEKLPEWWALQARRLAIKGQPDEAVDHIETALKLCGTDHPEWMALSARLLIEAGRPDEGIARLNEAVDLDSQTAVLWEEIGDVLAADEDRDGAIAAYERCLTALPERLDVFKKMGDCYAAKGQMEAAKAAYEVVVNKTGEGTAEGGRETADGKGLVD